MADDYFDEIPCGSSRESIPPGTFIDNYKIVRRISSGAMSDVYLADDTTLNRSVALKFLPAVTPEDTVCRERLIQEARAASKLNHPNIITIYSFGKFNSRDFIVMEYIEGGALRKLIQDGKIPVKDIIHIILQISDALKSAHDAGIIHRDLKPENILIDESKRVRICDFGLAFCQDSGPFDESASTSGSLAYMSPEQVQGDSLDLRSDLFSLGVILYELITGRLPFHGDYEAALIFAIVNTTPEPLAKYRSGLPEQLQDVVNRLLAKNKEDRYQSITEFAKAIRQLSASKPVKFPTDKNRLKIKYAMSFAAFAILAMLAIFIYLRHSDRSRMIVVLPFNNLGRPDNEYISQGVTDAITTALAKYSDLGVISATSARQYRNTTKGIRRIAAELDVDYVLEGSVVWNNAGPNSRLKINCQLIRAGDDRHLWAQTYEPEFGQLIDTQDEIAEKVVRDIAGRLPRLQSPDYQLSTNSRAYDCFLQGNYYFHRSWGEPDYQKAIQLYSSAINLDSNFIMAYIMLSKVHGCMFTDRYDYSDNRLALSLQAANHALEIQPNSPDGRLALGMYYYRTRQFGLAMELFEEVKSVEPNNSDLYGSIAAVQRRQGNFKDAIANFKHACILEPTSPLKIFDTGMTYGLTRDYSGAEKYMDRAITLAPDWPLPYIYKAWILLFRNGDKTAARLVLGEASQKTDLSKTEYYRFYWWISTIIDEDLRATTTKIIPISDTASYYLYKARVYDFLKEPQSRQAYFDSARAYLEPIVTTNPIDPSIYSYLGVAYAGLGRDDEAVREGKQAVAMLPLSTDAYDGQFLVANLAEIYVMLGQYDNAIEQLEILLSRPGFTSAVYLTIDPIWSKLWNDPKFEALIKKYK